jgi:predicted enzyme related to lactoylglutathione lyase
VDDTGPGHEIDVIETITEITVSDLQRSREWYSRLFGKAPDLEPFPGNVEFKVGGAWVQIVAGEVKPSSWTILFEVRDLSRERERLRRDDIFATEIRTNASVISWFDLKDPDGNGMRWFQVLTTDAKVTGNREY